MASQQSGKAAAAAAQQAGAAVGADSPTEQTNFNVAFVLYDGFELVDAMGPYQLLSRAAIATNDRINIRTFTVAYRTGLIPSANRCGIEDGPNAPTLGVEARYTYETVPENIDAIFVPGAGGLGWRTIGVHRVGGKYVQTTWKIEDSTDKDMILWLRKKAGLMAEKPKYPPKWICSVCTGSAVLCYCGIIGSETATANKNVLAIPESFMYDLKLTDGTPNTVKWQTCGRWVVHKETTPTRPFALGTSSGITAGMEIASYLLGVWFGPKVRDEVLTWNEYEWHSPDPFGTDC